MALTRTHKREVIDEVAGVAAQSHSLVAAEYRGMTASEITNLRRAALKSDVTVRVVKNNLARQALDGTDFACAQEHLSGPLILAFSREQPADGPRLFRDFSKENKKLIIQFGVYEQAVLDQKELLKLASLPTRDEALAQLMALMRAPITKAVQLTAQIPGTLARTLAAYRDHRQEAS